MKLLSPVALAPIGLAPVVLSSVALLLLAGCGAARELQPTEGHSLPVAPYGATTPPTARQLTRPGPQARPVRSDELLTNSDRRRVDDYDLPPPN